MRFPCGPNVRDRDGFRFCNIFVRPLARPDGSRFRPGAACFRLSVMELFVPLLIGLTLIWLVGRGVPWNAKLLTLAVTLAVIVLIVLAERNGYWPEGWQRR